MGTNNRTDHTPDGHDQQQRPSYNRHKPYKREAWLQETPRRQRITQRDIREHYGTEEDCEALFVGLRWPSGVECPCCHGRNIHRITTRRKFTCRDCDYRFTVTSCTYMHGTRTPLSTWLTVAYEMTEDAHGISANEIKRKENLAYGTAWSICQTIRKAMLSDLRRLLAAQKMTGAVEVDETWVGGKTEGWGRGFKKNKFMLIGIRQRGGAVLLEPISDRTRKTLFEFILRNVDPEGIEAVYTDDWAAYVGIGKEANAKHRTVNHSKKKYARGKVHTNSIESVWASWQRTWSGTHHHISEKYAYLYAGHLGWCLTHAHTDDKVFAILRVLLSIPHNLEEEMRRRRERLGIVLEGNMNG